jgi:hypothetical protein
MGFEQLLQRIMDSDVNIRHSIVSDAKGNIITVNHRTGVTNYLSEEETAASLVRAASAWKARKQLTWVQIKSEGIFMKEAKNK